MRIIEFFKEANRKRIEKNAQYEYEYGKRFGFSSHIIFTKARKKRKKAKKIYNEKLKRYFSLVYDISFTKLELNSICRELYKFRNYDDEISNKSKLENEMNKKIKRLDSLQEELSGSVKENLDKYGWLLRKIYKIKSKKFYRWDEHKFMSKYCFDEEVEDMYEEVESKTEEPKISKRNKYTIDSETLKSFENLYDSEGKNYFINDYVSSQQRDSVGALHNTGYESATTMQSTTGQNFSQEENEDLNNEKINMLIKDSTEKIEGLLTQAIAEMVSLGIKGGDRYKEKVLSHFEGFLGECQSKIDQIVDDVNNGANLTEDEIFERLNTKVLK